MNILIITGSLSGGGTERVSVILANFLSEKGHDISISIFRSGEINYTPGKNVKIHKLPSHKIRFKSSIAQKISYSVKDFLALKRIVEKFNIKKVISFSNPPAVLMLLLVKQTYLISSKRNYPPDSTSFIEKQVFSRSKTIVFQTPEQMEFYNTKIRKKGVILHNPILENLPGLYSQNKKMRKKEIVTFCRLARQKNLLMLLDGFAAIHEQFPDYILTIYGDRSVKDSSYQGELEEHIAALQMGHVIQIKKFTNDIHSLVVDATCFVLTSDYEGISNSMLEAMAIGLPVICTDCKGGGARAFINNNENGILIPVNDRDALSRALVYIISNPEEAKKMGEKALEISDLLSQEKICNKWMEILLGKGD